MNKPKFFRALAYALLAASFATLGALSTPPVSAYAAEEVEVADSMAVDGLITLGENKSYVVRTNLSNPIEITSPCTLTFENGAALTVPESCTRDAIHAYTNTSTVETVITGAKVVQPNTGYKAFRSDRSFVRLVNCDFTSAGSTCVDLEDYKLIIDSGTYTSTSDGASVVRRSYANLYVNGGTFVSQAGQNIFDVFYYDTHWSAEVTGGLFSNPDVVYCFGSDKLLAKDAATGYWRIIDNTEEASDGAYYYVDLASGRTVAYFATKEEADEFSALLVNSSVEKIEFDVTFDADGGSPKPRAQTVGKGQKATQPSTPHKKGYEFVGWYEDGDTAGSAFDFDSPVTSNHNLKAVYKENATQFNVTFNANGGTFPDGSAQISKTYTYGESLANPTDEDATLAGKFFDGWATKDGKTYKAGQPVTSNLELYAKWVDPVATCDGTSYKTLQEALENAKKGSHVTLLDDVSVAGTTSYFNGVVVGGVEGLTIDLGGHTLSCELSDEKGARGWAALILIDCDNAVVQNGTVRTNDARGVAASRCDGLKLVDLKVETSSSNPEGDEPIATCGLYAWNSSVTVQGGSCVSKGSSPAAYSSGCKLTIESGTFVAPTSASKYSDDDIGVAVVATNGSSVGQEVSLTVKGGDFTNQIVNLTNSFELTGGTFGSYENAADVASGYAMLKRAGESGRYEVVPVDGEGIPADACWKAAVAEGKEGSEDIVACDVYFEDAADANAFKESLEKVGGSVTLTRLRYKVSFESQGEVASTRLVRAGRAVGELPAGEEVAGWTFSGWYLDKEKVDASYIPGDDVTLVAMWTKDDSGDESDDPDKGDKGDDPDDPDKGDKGDGGKGSSDKNGSQSKKDAAMPQTGDSTNDALPVAIAVAGVAVVAAGLVFHARSKRK